MSKSRKHIQSRLECLNARLGMIRAFQSNGKETADPTTYPTYTQAKKVLKAIPRNVREMYEKSIRLTDKKQTDQVEKKRKDLRATEVPSERHASKKAQREDRKHKAGKMSALLSFCIGFFSMAFLIVFGVVLWAL
jgi:hypothetical protein